MLCSFSGDSPIPLRLSFKLASESYWEEVAWITSASLPLGGDAFIEIMSNPWILFLQLQHSYFPGTMLRVGWSTLTFWCQSRFISRKRAFQIDFSCLKTSQHVSCNAVCPWIYLYLWNLHTVFNDVVWTCSSFAIRICKSWYSSSFKLLTETKLVFWFEYACLWQWLFCKTPTSTSIFSNNCWEKICYLLSAFC